MFARTQGLHAPKTLKRCLVIPTENSVKTYSAFGLERRPDLRRFLGLLMGASMSCGLTFGLAAEMPYVTELNRALTLAKAKGRIVLLYTGRAELCVSNSPKTQLFQVIFTNHTRLAARSNEFVVCEHFGYAPGKDAAGQPSAAFFRDARMLEPLFDRYDIRAFWPTITFLDPDGNRLNGPFSYLMDGGCTLEGAQELFSNGRDCYVALSDYEKADRPLRLEEAQSKLVAAVTRPAPGDAGLAFFRFTYHPKGGAKPVLMENGLISDKFELGKQFSFSVRDGTNACVPGHKTQWPRCFVTVAGQFSGVEPFEEHFLVRLNGVHFQTTAMFSGTGPDHSRGYAGGITLGPGEYSFGIDTRQKLVAETLLTELKRLSPPIR
jgi:hypothetical protein